MSDFTGKLLLDEQPLIVLRPLVKVLGSVDKAIFTQQLHYMLVTYKDDVSHKRDGRVWVWNSYQQWHEYFNIWSFATTRRIIEALEGDKLVLTSTQYNVGKYDNCKWYSLDYQLLSSLLNPTRAMLNLSTPLAQSEQGAMLNLSKDLITKNSQRESTKNIIIDSDASFRIHNSDFDVFASGIWGRAWTMMAHMKKCEVLGFVPPEQHMKLRAAMSIAANAGEPGKCPRYVRGILVKMAEEERKQSARYSVMKGDQSNGKMWTSYCGVQLPAVKEWEHKQECQKCMEESQKFIQQTTAEVFTRGGRW